jgi:hypothetical protein
MAAGSTGDETLFVVKAWAVVIVILGLFGWFGVQAINHENRITKIETQFDYISRALANVEELSRQIRDDQIRRQEEMSR